MLVDLSVKYGCRFCRRFEIIIGQYDPYKEIKQSAWHRWFFLSCLFCCLLISSFQACDSFIQELFLTGSHVPENRNPGNVYKCQYFTIQIVTGEENVWRVHFVYQVFHWMNRWFLQGHDPVSFHFTVGAVCALRCRGTGTLNVSVTYSFSDKDLKWTNS